jgi:hypothetical protein
MKMVFFGTRVLLLSKMNNDETEFLDIPFDLNIMNDYTINEMYKQFDDFIKLFYTTNN